MSKKKKGNGGEGKENWKELRKGIEKLTATMDRQMKKRRTKRIVEKEMKEALKKIRAREMEDGEREKE